MKKSLLALAVLGVFAGAASAQSSVTLYGLVDLGVNKPIGTERKGVAHAAQSRLGVRGVEDLGGGMSAIFDLQHRFNADNGTVAAGPTTFDLDGDGVPDGSQPGIFWRAASWVGLQGGFGRVRLGRMTNYAWSSGGSFDPFTTDGVGSNSSIVMGGVVPVYLSNAIAYDINVSGFMAGAMIGERDDNFAPSNEVGRSSDKRPYNLSIGYAGGPISVSLAHTSNGLDDGDAGKWTSLGLSYDIGFAKLMGLVGDGKTNADGDKVRGYFLGAIVPLGAGQINASVGQVENRDADDTLVRKAALGYRHNLSKRTALYATFARDAAAGDEKNGYEVGVKHVF